MSGRKTTVVISQAQGRNPVKRKLEEDLATALIMDPNIDVSLIPHLYDMKQDHTGFLFLRSVSGNVVVLSWLYERAIRWTIDRAGIRGHEGQTLLKADDHDEDEDFAEEPPEPQGIGSTDVPDRHVYCIDLRASESCEDFVNEIRRIASENAVETVDLMSWISGSPDESQLQRYLQPERMLEARRASDQGNASAEDRAALPEDTARRWYPVIDYSRCTNCMECIDFCLFGVYGVDSAETASWSNNPTTVSKGCPACSRVCPENAIIFPQHKTPAIAGADGEVGGLKIDLSKLFGGDDGKSAIDTAVKERDAELLLDGRDAVGMSVGIKHRHAGEIDQLISELDALEF